MYAHHVPVIAGCMRESPEGFKRGVLFALLSIRQPITSVRGQLAEVDVRRADAPCLLGFKRQAYRQLELEGDTLWRDLREEYAPGAVIARLQAMHGLGIVKAGFVAQLMGCDVACLDSRNNDREGRNRRAYNYTKARATPQQVARLIDRYLGETEGRAAEYWDAWCCDVADAYGYTPEAISELHLDIVPDTYIPF